MNSPAPHAPHAPTPPHSDAPPLPRRSPSKIAQLPKPTRDRLNQLLADGVPYRLILEQLGPPAAHINEQNLSKWRRGPHQHWLDHRQNLEDHVTNLDFAADLLAHDTATLHEAALRLAAARLLNLLARLQDQPDPLANFEVLTSVVNALCRLSRETVRCERQRDESAQNQLLRGISRPAHATPPPPPNETRTNQKSPEPPATANPSNRSPLLPSDGTAPHAPRNTLPTPPRSDAPHAPTL